MEREKMQSLLLNGTDPETMVEIAENYLNGSVLQDVVAAEAWLMKAIEAEDPVISPKAMGLLATRILGKTEILTDVDYHYILSRVSTATGAEREELETLLRLVRNAQKKL